MVRLMMEAVASRMVQVLTDQAEDRALIRGLTEPGRLTVASRVVQVLTDQAVPQVAWRPGPILALRAEKMTAHRMALAPAMA